MISLRQLHKKSVNSVTAESFITTICIPVCLIIKSVYLMMDGYADKCSNNKDDESTDQRWT
jgi:hypothetical protein